MARKKAAKNDSPPLQATSAESPKPTGVNRRVSKSIAPPRILVVEDPDPADMAQSLGLEQFQEPDDAGISLEEFGQAYASLMTTAADPYEATAKTPNVEGEPTGGEVEIEVIVPSAEDEPLEVIAGDDDSAAEITPLTILEAMLFVGHPLGEPLTSQDIAGLMRGVTPAEIDEFIEELNHTYRRDGSVYHVVARGAGYRLELRSEWGPIRDRFYGRVKEARLSQSSVDVLAVVAYQQPITADEVERLRGKPSGAVLSQLVRRDLLSVVRPEPKAPPQYSTTSRFLDLFGLDDLGDLPQSLEGEKGL